MEQKKIAIIHRDEPGGTLAQLAQALGYITSTMQVGIDITPDQVASFVDGVKPDLVLLAENYQDLTTTPGINPEYWLMIKQGEGIEALAEIRRRGVTAPVYRYHLLQDIIKELCKKGQMGICQ